MSIQKGSRPKNLKLTRTKECKSLLNGLISHTTKSVTDLSFSATVPAVPKATTVTTSGKSVRIKQ